MLGATVFAGSAVTRRAHDYSGGTPWTYAHEEWLRRHRFDDVHLKAAFDHSFDAVLAATAAWDRLDEQIMRVAASPRFADPVNRLGLATEPAGWMRADRTTRHGPVLSASAWVMRARGLVGPPHRHQEGVTADIEKTLAVDVYAVVYLQRDADAHHLGVD